MPFLERDGDVFILHLGVPGDERPVSANENRFHPDWLTAVEGHLDELEAHDGPAALVTVGADKFYSNGLDIAYVGSAPNELPAYIDRIHAVYSRILRLPMATVAAVGGHAFGGGAMLALAHDVRVGRLDRGFICLPEALLKMPFPVGMAELVKGRLPAATAVEAMTTGRRYGGAEILTAGWVHHGVEGEDAVLAKAVEIARAAAPGAGANLAGIKRHLVPGMVEALAVKTEPFGFG